MIRWTLILLLLFTLLAALGLQDLKRRWEQPLAIPAGGFELHVVAGDSLRAVSNNLHRQGVLPYPRLLQVYGRWTGLDAKIKRGEYQLPPQLTAQGLLLLLQEGKVIQYQVTLPEGITLLRALEILAGQEELLSLLEGVDDSRLTELIAPASSPEGLFFPDSYYYQRGDSDWDIVQRAFHVMADELAAQWSQRADGLPYETPYEALVMASIIERETGQPDEREQIAGVFVRRLQKGMRLQTDPTVIYGLGSSFDGNLKRVHLKDESNPYNTYRHGGLPPSPIALPGRAAIRAALHPAAGDTLYFVATGDGAHVFSATLEEHQRAVRQYQLQRKKGYRSSPGRP